MPITKRDNIWWIDITHHGKRIRQSTGTQVKSKAQQLHDKLKFDLWTTSAFNSLPQKYWMDAVLRWLEESSHKRTLSDDKIHLRWIDPFMRGLLLTEINQDHIEAVAKAREDTNVSPATINRMLEVIRAILRKAQKEWGWLLSVPAIRMRKINNKRIRWLTRDESKTKKAIPVPLNRLAMTILQEQKGKHPIYVFTYKGNPVTRCNNHAWRKALIRAGIKDFRWHDLRHTWASWHVQNGTSLHELQQLGGWSNYETVLRYAHLSGQHLQEAADRII